MLQSQPLSTECGRIMLLSETGLDLGILGVPLKYQTRPPCPEAFPLVYNPEAEIVWTSMFSDPEFLILAEDLRSRTSLWNLALREFLYRSRQSGIAPFAYLRDEQDNGQTIQFLAQQRRQIVRALDVSKLFENVNIEKMMLERTYKVSLESFYVKSCIVIRDFVSMTDLQNVLKKQGFYRILGSTWRKRISPHSSLFVSFKNNLRATVWYEITSPFGLFLPPKEKISSKAATTKWIETKIWTPILRATPLLTLKRRSLF